jgi:hypothetical protein
MKILKCSLKIHIKLSVDNITLTNQNLNFNDLTKAETHAW